MKKINKENIEAWLLDLAEGTINEEDKKEVYAFLEQNPEYKGLLSLYDESLVLTEGETVVFQDKESLKHKVAFPLWKRVACVALSAAAVLLLLIFLRPTKEVLTNSQNCDQPVARQTNSIARQDNEDTSTNKSTFIHTKHKHIASRASSLSSFETEKSKELDMLSESADKDVRTEKEPIYIAETFSQELPTQNNTVSSKPLNDTVYIIYVGDKKQNRTQAITDFIEKHTNIDLAPTVTFIRQTTDKVKETKNKYLKI